MEKYEITIEKLIVKNEEKYPNKETVYVQVFVGTEEKIKDIVATVNKPSA